MFVDTLNSGDFGALILDKTNFYAEQGGQIFDTGVLTKIGDEACFVFNVVIKVNFLISQSLHFWQSVFIT